MAEVSLLNYNPKDFESLGRNASIVRPQTIDIDAPPRPEEFLEQVIETISSKERPDDFVWPITQAQAVDIKSSHFWEACSKQGLVEQRLKDLKSSIRLTNIQKLHPWAKETCRRLTLKYRLPSTCNIYITPGVDYNCLGIHSDIQETFVWQLLGKKNWTFFQEEDESTDLKKDNSTISQKHSGPSRNLVLEQGDFLYLPANIVHRAQGIGEQVSVHLTFALNLVNRRIAMEYFFNQVVKNLGEKHDFSTPLNHEELIHLLNDLQKSAQQIDPNLLMEDFQTKAFFESLRLIKQGRNYSKS